MKKFGTLSAGLAVLVAVAGLAASVNAQQETGARDRSSVRVVQHAPDFRSSKWLSERKVVNTNGEDVATVGDLILDRGSGVVEYAVLKTGTILGLGGKRMAVSFSALRWNDAGEHFVLPLTVEQLNQFPEFSEEEWKNVIDTKADSKVLRQRLLKDATAASRDPYAASLAEAKQSRVKGQVTNVERVDLGDYQEHIVLTVRTEDGDRRVTLGPSWFVNSASFAPMRGDQVTIEAAALPRDPEKTLVARTMRIGDRDVTLRNEEGAPSWVMKADDSADQRSNAARRYLLISALNGAQVDCRGAECGKVGDTILERRSAAVAFLSIDPNENFLGIADTKRLVPWSVASVASDGAVRLDASKEMVLASPVTPSEIASLNSGGVGEMVYKAYEVPAPRFEPRRPVAVTGARPADAWATGGPVMRAIKKDSVRTVTGKNQGVMDVNFTGEVPAAHALKINENGVDVLVLLGPSWYIKNQEIACKTDENVVVETCRVTIGGKDYLMAKSVKCGGSTVVMINESGAPAWDNR